MLPYARLKALNRKAQLLKILTEDETIEVMPSILEIQNTAFCNLACPFCESHGTEELRKQNNRIRMNQDLLYRLAGESLPYAKSYSLTVSGEPLASPRFHKILTDFSEYGTKLHCTTNGTLLRDKVLVDFILGSEEINISVDGAAKETFERLRGGAIYEEVLENVYHFSQVVRNIRSDLRPVVSFALTIMGTILEELPGMIYMAHKTGVKNVMGHFMVAVSEEFKVDEIQHHKARYNAALKESLRLANNYGINVMFPPPFPDVDTDAEICFPEMETGYYAELDKVIELFESARDEEQVTELVFKITEQADKASKPMPIEMQEAMDQWNADLNKVIKDNSESLTSLLSSKKTLRFCKTLFNKLYVNPEGQVAPCCYIPATIANVVGESVRSVWNGDAFNQFRKDVVSKTPPRECVGCPQMVEQPADMMASEVLSSPKFVRVLEEKDEKITELHHVLDAKDKAIHALLDEWVISPSMLKVLKQVYLLVGSVTPVGMKRVLRPFIRRMRG